MWITAEQRHGEGFRSAEAVRAREKDHGASKARPLADVDHDGLGRRVMIRITDVIPRDLLPCEVVEGGEARGDGETKLVEAAAVDANIDDQTAPPGAVFEDFVEGRLQAALCPLTPGKGGPDTHVLTGGGSFVAGAGSAKQAV